MSFTESIYNLRENIRIKAFTIPKLGYIDQQSREKKFHYCDNEYLLW